MNKIFKVIYNKALGVFMAVSELASGQGKERSSQIKRADSKKSLTRQSFPFTLSLLSFSLFLNLMPHTAEARFVTISLGNISSGGWGDQTNLPKAQKAVGLNSPNEAKDGYTDGNNLGEGSVAIGYQAKAKEGNNVAIGREAIARGEATVVGHKSGANGQAIALGSNVYAWGTGSIALGGDDLISDNNFSINYSAQDGFISAETAKRRYGLKFPDLRIFERLYLRKGGVNPFFTNETAFLNSYGNRNGYDYRIFSPTYAAGRGAIAIGTRSLALGDTSTALGALSLGLSDESTAVGFLSYVDVGAKGGIAVGRNSRVFSGNSVSVGNLTEASAIGSMAYGYDAKAVGEGSIAIGREVAANAYFDVSKTSTLVSKYNDLSRTIVDERNSDINQAFSTFDTGYATYFQYGNDGDNSVAVSSLPLYSEGTTYFTVGDVAIKKTSRFFDASNGIVIGNKSFAVKKNSIALGYAALADADNSFAFGSYSSVQAGGVNSAAIGVGAYVSGRFGNDGQDKPNSTAVGTFAAVKGSQNSFAGGAFTSVSGSPNSVALGAYAKINQSLGNNIAFGFKAETSSSNSVVIGSNAKTLNYSDNSLVFGNNAQLYAGSGGAIVIGDNAKIGQGGMNSGEQSKGNAENSIAFGSNAIVGKQAKNSVAFGTNAKVENEVTSSMALGNQAKVSMNNSVALGFQSTTTYLYIPQTASSRASQKNFSPTLDTDRGQDATRLPGYVPVGSSYVIPVDNSAGVISVGGWIKNNRNKDEVGLRRIINVAPGALDTDVATVGQLRALEFTKTEPNLVYYTIDSTGNKIKLVYDQGNFYPVNTANGEPLFGTSSVPVDKVLIGPKNPAAMPINGSNVSVLNGATGNKNVTPLGDALPFGNISSIVVSSGQGYDKSASTQNTAVITPTYLYLGADTNEAGTNVMGSNFGIKLSGVAGSEGINIGKASGKNLFINKNSIQAWGEGIQGTGIEFTRNKIITLKNFQGGRDNITLTGVDKGLIYETSSDAVNAAQLHQLGITILGLNGNFNKDFTLPTFAPVDAVGVTNNPPTRGKTTFKATIDDLITAVNGGYAFSASSATGGKQILGTSLKITEGDIENGFKGSNLKTKYQLNDRQGTITIGLTETPEFKTVTAKEGNEFTKLTKSGLEHSTNGRSVDSKITLSGSAITFSNGGSNTDIRLTGVAKGTTTNDAVNYDQLTRVTDSLQTVLGRDRFSVSKENNGIITFGLNNTDGKGIGGTGKTTIEEAIKYVKENAGGKFTYQVNGVSGNTQTNKLNFVANSDTGTSGNILITDKSGGKVQFALNQNINVTKVTAGNSILNDNGLAINKADGVITVGTNGAQNSLQIAANSIQAKSSGQVTSGFSFIDSKITLLGTNASSNGRGVTITNVAAGVNDTDAVNFGQL
ncbi:hypothetical protein CEP48_04610 [Mergibacter septicus]|uniref:Uncharacterized protein n=2 Tax=Mergibacter septicus TaxID=221402 RepID=A0A8E3S9Z8_9PAST|nr:ESPR-type extended signal peptide-containing protein [Mergibacter septicus]QDJ14749.1 hypothetical protein CEP48_04610 [Mergibacter septicus]